MCKNRRKVRSSQTCISVHFCTELSNKTVFIVSIVNFDKILPLSFYFLKETRNSYFSVTPKNHPLMFVRLNYQKSTVTKKSDCVFL